MLHRWAQDVPHVEGCRTRTYTSSVSLHAIAVSLPPYIVSRPPGHGFLTSQHVGQRLYCIVITILFVTLGIGPNLQSVHRGDTQRPTVRQDREGNSSLQLHIVWETEYRPCHRSIPRSPHPFCECATLNFFTSCKLC